MWPKFRPEKGTKQGISSNLLAELRVEPTISVTTLRSLVMLSRLFLTATMIGLAASAPAQDAKAIIEAGIKAAGWDKVKGDYASWSDEGKLFLAGQTMEYKADWKVHEPTGRYSMDLKMTFDGMKMNLSHRFDGKTAFESMGDIKQDVSGPKLEYSKNSGYLFRVSSLRSLLTSKTDKITVLEVPAVNKRPTNGVMVKTPDLRAITLFFDADSKLLVKSEMTVANEFDDWKDVLEESFYGDWTDAGGGVKNFKSLKVVRGGKTLIESKLSNAKVEEKPDWAETAFVQPK